jgi:hypothetical protein
MRKARRYRLSVRVGCLYTTDDWVVTYREGNDPSQWTVVTETSGLLEGRRVVRGREADCRTHYEEQASPD